MRTTQLATVVLAILIAGCGSEKNSQTEEVVPVADAPAEPPRDPKADLIEACHLKMTAPEVREWTTYWNPRAKRAMGEGPSYTHSTYWGNEEERKAMADTKTEPLHIICAAKGPKGETEIGLGLSTVTLTEQDVPFGPGTYAIVARSADRKAPPPKGIYVSPMSYGGSVMWEATSGTLTITRYDDQGIAGSFTFDAKERVMQQRTMKVEGTFDMPCRGGVLESACKANKARSD